VTDERDDADERPTNANIVKLIETQRTRNTRKPAGAGPKFRALRPHQFPDPTYPKLVRGLVDERDLILAYGASSSGKSFAMIDLALSIAAGRTWQNRPTLGGAVVYVAAEAGASVRRRVQAWMLHNERVHPEPPVSVIGEAPDLFSPLHETDELAAVIQASAKEMGQPLRLVVLDTMHAVTTGSKEDAEDTGKFLLCLKWLQEKVQCTIVVVHHSGKDAGRGARGSSSLEAAFDVVLEVVEDKDEVREVFVRKLREDRLPKLTPFRIQSVHLRTDDEGHRIGSAVAVGVTVQEEIALDAEAETDPRKAKARKLHAEGVPIRDIARTVGAGKSTVGDWLKG
jgi:hypothetical protein